MAHVDKDLNESMLPSLMDIIALAKFTMPLERGFPCFFGLILKICH